MEDKILDNLPAELSKRISRRQFLFRGKDGEVGGLPLVVGLGAAGLGVMGLASPGPNSQAFQDAYVRKKPSPPPAQTIQSAVSNDNRVLDIIANDDNAVSDKNWTIGARFANNHPTYPSKYGILFDPDGGLKAFKFFLLEPWDGGPLSQVSTPFVGSTPSVDFPGLIAVVVGGGNDDGFGSDSWNWNRFSNIYSGPGFGEMRNTRLSTQAYDAFNIDSIGRSMFIDTATVNGRPDRLAWREATTPTNLRDALAADELDKTTTGLVSIGPPAAAAGTTNRLADQGHRHGFSGRLLGAQATLPLGQGAGLPFNFARVKINNNWTLRRIWVYAQAGPTGGTETYAIVNAAGAPQGTGVVLPAGAGPQQAESALQVTNLTGATLYYVAQTAIGGGWLAGSTNTEVGFEYTPN